MTQAGSGPERDAQFRHVGQAQVEKPRVMGALMEPRARPADHCASSQACHSTRAPGRVENRPGALAAAFRENTRRDLHGQRVPSALDPAALAPPNAQMTTWKLPPAETRGNLPHPYEQLSHMTLDAA